MINISTEAIISQKVLPYDIYDVNKDLLFSAGEILTPGKIMSLRGHEILYIKERKETRLSHPVTIKNENAAGYIDHAEERPLIPTETVNKTSKIAASSQVSLKTEYAEAINSYKRGEITIARKAILSIRDKISKETHSVQKNVHYCSELKLLGEHYECHALNTAIYSAFLARKLEYSESIILDIVLGALLHDIGKTKIPSELFRSEGLAKEQEALYRKHPIYGYNIIKYKMKFPEHIAKIALEHHETPDGTGWPYGISSTMINEYAQIIAVCNYFDNLTSEHYAGEVKSFRESLKALLTQGSKTFSPKPLYAFVHMLNYGDSASFEELLT